MPNNSNKYKHVRESHQKQYGKKCQNNKECLRCIDNCPKQQQANSKGKVNVYSWDTWESCYLRCAKRYTDELKAKQKAKANPLYKYTNMRRIYSTRCWKNNTCLSCMKNCPTKPQVNSKGIVNKSARDAFERCHARCPREFKRRRKAKRKANANALKGCGSGMVRNKLTNRCIKKNGPTAKALKKNTNP